MMIIRNEQIAALEKAAFASFEQRARTHLAEKFPAVCARLGSQRLAGLIRNGIEKARGYGFEIEAQVAGYLDLMLTFGPNFDTDARHAWAHPFLLESAETPAMRMHQLLEQAKLHEHLRVRVKPQKTKP
jgi:hypothetical protein